MPDARTERELMDRLWKRVHPLLPPPAPQVKLKLTGTKTYKTGIMSLDYTILYDAA